MVGVGDGVKISIRDKYMQYMGLRVTIWSVKIGCPLLKISHSGIGITVQRCRGQTGELDIGGMTLLDVEGGFPHQNMARSESQRDTQWLLLGPHMDKATMVSSRHKTVFT